MKLQRPIPGSGPGIPGHGGQTRRAVVRGFTPLAMTLAMLIVASPVTAETCVPTLAAFPPGNWIAKGITIDREDTDGISALVTTETGGFGLNVDDTGAVSGTFSMVGEGALEMIGSDEGTADASWIKTGQLQGTGSLIQVDGEVDFHIEGGVDVEPNHDDDQFNGSGQDVFGFEHDFTRPFSMLFSPSAANCNEVFGSLDGPVEYDTARSQAYFLAVRVGARAHEVDVQGQLATLLEQAQTVLNMDPVDTDVLGSFVIEMLQFEALLASLESCDVGNELDMGGAWQMLQSVMFNTVHHFLDAAAAGEYPARTVVTVFGLWLQGGSLGLRGGECLSPEGANTEALGDILAKTEDVLLSRIEKAFEAGDKAEYQVVAWAAYAYQFETIQQFMEGHPL